MASKVLPLSNTRQTTWEGAPDGAIQESGAIPISALNPDRNGDGKLEKWEKECFERIKEADVDKSGAISGSELFGVIKGAAESDKQKRLFQKLFGGAVIVILALAVAMLGVGIAAGEVIKESHVNAEGIMTTRSGGPLTVSVTQEVKTLFDLPTLEMAEMARVESVTFWVEMPAPSSALQMAVRPSSMHTADNNMAVVMTPEGHAITIYSTEQTASIVMGAGPHAGATYPVTLDPPSSARKLVEASEKRRNLRRGGNYHASSGRFMLSSGVGYGSNAAGN